MANEVQLTILNQGVEVWNKWRIENPSVKLNLSGADLDGANLNGVDLYGANLKEANLLETNFSGAKLLGAELNDANLTKADLNGANLYGANFSKANLTRANLTMVDLTAAEFNGANLYGADFYGANLYYANFSKANLSKANFSKADLNKANFSNAKLSEATFLGANLSETNLSGADLSRANLSEANFENANFTGVQLIDTNLENTNLSGCRIYGISAWDIKINDKTNQSNLIITKENEPVITVDNLEVAQFIYLLLNNQKIRHVIDTITSKVVLILGRFTPERKVILDAIREELRKHDYLPVLFDFDKPSTKDTHETITTLARLAKFIIADITDPKSIPQELVSIVETLPSLVVQPILQNGYEPWGMFDHIKRYPWVLEIHQYNDWDSLNQSLAGQIIPFIETKIKEIRKEISS